jgi:hypothetical protein
MDISPLANLAKEHTWEILTIAASAIGYMSMQTWRHYRLRNEKTYSHPYIRLHCCHSPGGRHFDLFSTVRRAIGDKEGIQFLILLGDYGTGKSYFLAYLYYWLKRREWRTVTRVKLIRLITQNLDQHIVAIPVDERSQTILLLDGFDEDLKAIRSVAERFVEIVSMTQEFKKVIITSRLNFWGELKPETVNAFVENFEARRLCLYLQPFSERQVKRYLYRKFAFRPLRARSIVKQLRVNDVFRDLSTRPLLLSYFDRDVLSGIENITEYLPYLDNGRKNLKRRVFEVVTQKAFKRKDSAFFKDQESFDRIMMTIAYHILVTGQPVAFDEFAKVFQQIKADYKLESEFNPHYIKLLEEEERAIRTRMLLVKVGDRIEFSHRSIAEYYAALFIETFCLKESKSDFYIATKEVGEFISFEKDGLRFVPRGKITMISESGRRDYTIDSLFIGLQRVTLRDYLKFDPKQQKQYDLQPADAVTYVSWNKAKQYCDYLSKLHGRPYRLASELEWEYACRGGIHDWTLARYPDRSNPFCIPDMSSDLWEWCEEKFDATNFRVLRRKSRNTNSMQASERFGHSPDIGKEDISFRIVTTLSGKI